MRYRRPFTSEQRRRAAKDYELLRSHVRLLRKAYPPLDAAQRGVFRRYQNLVHAVGSELLKVDALVNTDELNRLARLAASAAAEYYRARQFDV